MTRQFNNFVNKTDLVSFFGHDHHHLHHLCLLSAQTLLSSSLDKESNKAHDIHKDSHFQYGWPIIWSPITWSKINCSDSSPIKSLQNQFAINHFVTNHLIENPTSTNRVKLAQTSAKCLKQAEITIIIQAFCSLLKI